MSDLSNPFTTPEGAENWIRVVEGQDVFRENYIYPRVTEWLAQLATGSVVADIGCGQGVCAPLVSEGITYMGIEPSEALVSRAIELHGNKGDCKFYIGTAYDTGLEDNSVDSVFSVHVWFHLDDLFKATKEAARILRPGGNMLVIAANPLGYEKWHSFYKNLTVNTDKMIRGTLDFGGPHQINDSTFYNHSWPAFLAAFVTAGFDTPVRDSFPEETKTSMALTTSRKV